MPQPLLVVNAGSSSIKFSIYDIAADRSLSLMLHGEVAGIGSRPLLEVMDAKGHKLVANAPTADGHDAAMAAILDWFSAHVGSETSLYAAGHRVVHGGERYSGPVLIDDEVISELEALIPLAPLHQPHQIAAIRAIRAAAPELRQVACFDTAFHHNQPWVAQAFALPRDFTSKGVRRYGFHGLSYEYITSELHSIAPDCTHGRLIVLHLGNGASMCAIDNGRSIASTMGFTALDGLPMGTRSGSLDPGVILYLLQHEGLDAATIEHLLYERSGLLGVSGFSGDMRVLLASDLPSAREAVDLFVYRIGRELGSLVAALGGLDGLVFTGGIGEHAEEIRARVCKDAYWIGVRLDEQANLRGGPCISQPWGSVSAWVVPTDENQMIALHTRNLVGR